MGIAVEQQQLSRFSVLSPPDVTHKLSLITLLNRQQAANSALTTFPQTKALISPLCWLYQSHGFDPPQPSTRLDGTQMINSSHESAGRKGVVFFTWLLHCGLLCSRINVCLSIKCGPVLSQMSWVHGPLIPHVTQRLEIVPRGGYLLMGSAAGFSHSSVFASPLGLSLGFWDRRDDIVAAVTTALKLRFRFCTFSSGWKIMMYTFGM